MKQLEKISELKDIVEMINRYNIVHKDGCFLFRFIGFKKDPTCKCAECGKDCDEIDDLKSLIGAHGNLEILREMSNELRDIIEDMVDKNGFVNINEFGKENE